jgi:hypothetical protein
LLPCEVALYHGALSKTVGRTSGLALYSVKEKYPTWFSRIVAYAKARGFAWIVAAIVAAARMNSIGWMLIFLCVWRLATILPAFLILLSLFGGADESKAPGVYRREQVTRASEDQDA